MAHEVETMAWAGQVPWHGLGVEVSNDLTPAQMMKKAGLNWKVIKADLEYSYKNKRFKSDLQALIRDSDGQFLSEVNNDWEPCQNEEFMEFFSEFVHAGGMEMHTAGSLRQGKMTWALAKIKDASFNAVKGGNVRKTVNGKRVTVPGPGGSDPVESYLLFSNPHEYGKCIDIRYTGIRVVCNNTMQLALDGGSDRFVRLTHRKKFDPDYVKETLGLATKRMAEYQSMAQFLAGKKAKPEAIINYFKTVFPKLGKPIGDAPKDAEETFGMSRPAKTAFQALETQPGAEHAQGSWWQPFNAATFTIDHLIGRGNETRIALAWYGSRRKQKELALKTAVELANAA